MQHAIEALIFRWSCLSGYCVVAPPRRGFGAHVFRPIVVRTHLVSNLFVSGRGLPTRFSTPAGAQQQRVEGGNPLTGMIPRCATEIRPKPAGRIRRAMIASGLDSASPFGGPVLRSRQPGRAGVGRHRWPGYGRAVQR